MGKDYGLPVLLERLGARGGAASQWGTSDVEGRARSTGSSRSSPASPPDQWEAAYEKILAPLPPGVYQLIVHLGYDDEEMQGATSDHPDWGAAWRQHDFDMVRGAKFQQFLRDQHFMLTTWRKLGTLRQ